MVLRADANSAQLVSTSPVRLACVALMVRPRALVPRLAHLARLLSIPTPPLLEFVPPAQLSSSSTPSSLVVPPAPLDKLRSLRLLVRLALTAPAPLALAVAHLAPTVSTQTSSPTSSALPALQVPIPSTPSVSSAPTERLLLSDLLTTLPPVLPAQPAPSATCSPVVSARIALLDPSPTVLTLIVPLARPELTSSMPLTALSAVMV
jgi:hypothetical protein